MPLDDPRLRDTQAHALAERVDRTELQKRIGFTPVTTELYPGVYIPCEAYACQVADHFVFGMLCGVTGTAVGKVEVWTQGPEQVCIVLLALELPEAWLKWRSDCAPKAARPWRVLRQDDNGNEFELARFADQNDALLYASLWQQRLGTHKQMTFVSEQHRPK